MKLTGYMTGANYSKVEELAKAQELDRLKAEAIKLKEQMAQFQMMMQNPEYQALVAKLAPAITNK